MSANDPHMILGVPPGAGADELAGAYRRLAKRWHPDHGGSAERMAAINEAYAVLLAGDGAQVRVMPDEEPAPAPRAQGARRKGWWLPQRLRIALGAELLGALDDGERVELVTGATVSGSRAVLVVTERRLMWLLDDAVTGRVRVLAHRAVEGAEIARARLFGRRDSVTLRVRTTRGRRLAFSHLNPTVADRIVRELSRSPDGPPPR